MIRIHATDQIGATILEQFVQELDLFLPAGVGALLAIREEEILAAVKDTVRCGGNALILQCLDVVERESGIDSSDAKKTAQAQQQGGGAAGLEDKLVGEHKHARLGKEVGVNVIRVDDGQDLAVDHIQHALPDGGADRLQAILFDPRRKSLSTRRKPDLEKFLGSLKGVGGVQVSGNLVVDGELGLLSGDAVGDVGGSHAWRGLGCVGYVLW